MIEEEMLSQNEEIDYKGFNLNQASDDSSQSEFNTKVDDETPSKAESSSIYSGEADYKTYGASVSLDSEDELGQIDGEVESSQIGDEDSLTLDDSDSISQSLKEELELDLTLDDEDHSTDIDAESAIEFTDSNETKKQDKSHYDDDLGAIKFE